MIPSLRAAFIAAKQSQTRREDCLARLGFDTLFAANAQGYSTISPPRSDGVVLL